MNRGILALIAVLIIGGLGVGYYFYRAPGPAPVASPTTYADSNSTLGISLAITLSPSTIPAGGEVNYSASVFNTRLSVNNLSSASSWALPDLIMTACGPTDSPIAFAVIQGHYVPGNISKAPGVNYGELCTTVMGGVRAYSFQPTSDVASVLGSCSPNPCFTRAISTWRELTQYQNGVGIEGQGLNFTRGTYTVVAEDEWGDIALASFAVS